MNMDIQHQNFVVNQRIPALGAVMCMRMAAAVAYSSGD